jgi:hypothetical protein
MGSFITVPETLHTQESVEQEVNRLLHSYSYLLKGILDKGTIDKFDVMKQSLIHQQWGMVSPLLHSSKKDKYNKIFHDYRMRFQSVKQIGLSPIQELEEKLLD